MPSSSWYSDLTECYGFCFLNDARAQVLHNPVTLKLQEEEEEQLLAQ
jgi:hypothetical protein